MAMIRAERNRPTGGGGGGGGTLLWSVLYAAALAGDAIDVSVPVTFDLVNSPNYALVTLQNGAYKTLDRTKSTQLNCTGMVRMGGSTDYAGTLADPFPSTFTHTRNYTGARANEIPGNLSSPASAVPTSNRAGQGMPGSARYWVAQMPAETIVKLAATANIGDSTLSLDRAVTWKAGTVIEVGSTMFNLERPGLNMSIGEDEACSNYGSERCVVAADVTSSTIVTILRDPRVAGTGLQFRHFGQLQYMTAKTRGGVTLEDRAGTNLSLTDYGIQAGDVFGTTVNGDLTGTRVLSCLAGLTGEIGAGGARGRVLDNRCSIGVISCPLKITGPDDNDWWVYGYGVTDMTMGNTSIDQMRGVEVFRCGKAGQLGAYPLHHHLRSYTPFVAATSTPAAFIADVDKTLNFTDRCAIHDSSNRGFTIHGTCGYSLTKTVFANIDTHSTFLEDGSEIRNIIDGNLTIGVNRINQQMIVNSAAHGVTPVKATAIKFHDRLLTARFFEAGAFFSSPFDTTNCGNAPTGVGLGPSGIWMSHPTNYHRNNIYVGCYVGVWNNFQRKPFGFSAGAPGLNGFRTTTLEHNNNEAGCCTFLSMSTNPHVVDESGNLTGGPSSNDIAFDGDSYQYGVNVDNGVIPAYANREFFTNMNFWKSSCAHYQNEAHDPQYEGWHVAGVTGRANPRNMSHNDQLMIFGNGRPRFRGFCVWPNTLDTPFLDVPQTIMLSYGAGAIEHSNFFAPSTMTVISSQASTSIPAPNDEITYLGGLIHLWDFYLHPIYPPAQAFGQLTQNTVIAGHTPGCPGIFLPPPWSYPQFGADFTAVFDPRNPAQGNHKTARGMQGAIKLPADGSFFNQSGWWTFDSPYMLYNTTGSIYALPTATSDVHQTMNGKLLPATYNFYGLQMFGTNVVDSNHNGIWGTLLSADGSSHFAPNGAHYVAAINYTRMQADGLTPVANGTWNTPRWSADPGESWENMRHAVIEDGEFVDISWPVRADVPMPVSFAMAVYGVTPQFGAPAGANFFFSIDFSNGTSPGTPTYDDHVTHNISPVANLAAVLASPGMCYWQDTTNNKLFFHIVAQTGGTNDGCVIRVNDTITGVS